MINSQEVNKFLVILDVLVGAFDSCLEIKNLILFPRLTLEEVLKSRLALAKLFHLILITSLFALRVRLHPNYLISAKQGLIKTLEIHQLSFKPYV